MRTRRRGSSIFLWPTLLVTLAAAVALATTKLCLWYVSRSQQSKRHLQGSLLRSGFEPPEPCEQLNQTEYWGDVVVWGDQHRQPSVRACCQSCRDYITKIPEDSTCNVWVYCEDKIKCGKQHQQCWLKHLPHADGVAPKAQGAHVPWTSGVIRPPGARSVQGMRMAGGRSFHVIISAAGSAVHWQSRICHFQYRRVKAACEAAGKCEMGGFTRLLHEGRPDDLMAEIPTFVADPLPAEQQPDDGFVVLNRPYAFLQWVQKAVIPERYVLMSEPDHLWLKPLSNIMVGERPSAFPFFYIEPWKDQYLTITRKHLGFITKRQAEEIAPIERVQRKSRASYAGNAPTLLSWKDLERVCPQWLNTSLAIYNDKESRAAWGWVQEMYGFTLAAYAVGLGHVDLHRDLMSQPPWDFEAARFNILHYTYGMDYALNGTFTPGVIGEWRFDKRSYGQRPPPRNLPDPPAGMQNDLVRSLIRIINEATEAIPRWDQYAVTGHASQAWNVMLPS